MRGWAGRWWKMCEKIVARTRERVNAKRKERRFSAIGIKKGGWGKRMVSRLVYKLSYKCQKREKFLRKIILKKI